MRFSDSLLLALLYASSVSTVPTRRQTGQTSLPPAVISTAGGNIPNAPPPPTPSNATLNDFQIAEFLENMESAFFQAGVKNLTAWGMDGYPANTLDVVSRVAAQEQVHVATFDNLLRHFNTTTIPPCRYAFPVSNTAEFLQLAQVITTVGIGAVIDLAASVADTDPALLQNIASTVTVEARHDSFFRQALSLVPNPAPQDTRISPLWALNLALPFVVPKSCPLSPSARLFPAMGVLGRMTGTTKTITFTTAVNVTESMYIGWVNQANVPVYTNVTITAGVPAGIFTTTVPPGMGGMAFAALTGQMAAQDVGALTVATVAGPAIVQDVGEYGG
ncbi:hypothetical protein MMC30_005996 [Trapelia coarctata]|nr:hypothetical protein [Trapelia coarctata]